MLPGVPVLAARGAQAKAEPLLQRVGLAVASPLHEAVAESLACPQELPQQVQAVPWALPAEPQLEALVLRLVQGLPLVLPLLQRVEAWTPQALGFRPAQPAF